MAKPKEFTASDARDLVIKANLPMLIAPLIEKIKKAATEGLNTILIEPNEMPAKGSEYLKELGFKVEKEEEDIGDYHKSKYQTTGYTITW